jgi:hypothetical protein
VRASARSLPINIQGKACTPNSAKIRQTFTAQT